MRFPDKKNTGCPEAPSVFPPKKDDILHPALGCLGAPLALPQSLYGRTDVRTGVRWRHNQVSWIDRLPDLFTHGSLRACYNLFADVF